MKKTCPKCKIEKELNEFNSQKTRCIICHRKAGQEWRDNNVEKNRECQLEYNKSKRDISKRKTQSKEHYERNKVSIIAKSAINNKKRILFISNKIIDFLLNNSCIDCNEKNPLKLSFDHVRDKKEFNISDGIRMGFSEKKIFEEIKKCEVRCFNCHMEKTAINANYASHKILKERGYFS